MQACAESFFKWIFLQVIVRNPKCILTNLFNVQVLHSLQRACWKGKCVMRVGNKRWIGLHQSKLRVGLSRTRSTCFGQV